MKNIFWIQRERELRTVRISWMFFAESRKREIPRANMFFETSTFVYFVCDLFVNVGIHLIVNDESASVNPVVVNNCE